MIRLMLADDHLIFRQGLARILSEHADFEVVAQAGTCPEVIESLRTVPVDVLILDLTMPGRGGIELISHAKSVRPNLRVLVLTMHGEDPYLTQALRAGAEGYMTKEGAAEDIAPAIRRVFGGGRYVCAAVAERIALGFSSPHDDDSRPHARLSEREYRIFEMLVAGKRGWEIANELSVSEKTVSTHKSHVLRKINVSNRTELLLYAIRHQLVAV